MRKKPTNLIPVKDLKSCDSALAEIAALKRKVSDIENRMNDEIDRIKAEADAETAKHRTRIAALENGINAFSEFNRIELFSKRKTVELTFGLIGYRQSTKISTKRDTLEKLEEMGFTEAIKVSKKINKDVLREWTEERLALVDAKRVVEDTFWYELKEEEVMEAA